MGKKNKGGSALGKSLINDRFSNIKRRAHGDSSMIHTTDLKDGYDWGRLNLQSVTEESSFQEFLSTAELAGTEFEAEKLNLKFVKPSAEPGILRSADEVGKVNRELLRIPRRPPWDKTTTPEQLELAERESFLQWRRQLAIIQDEEGFLLTPYEKNLEFWRQLWRVVERSDVIVQIVDARVPLMFRCHDLEKYVKEVSPHKFNVILINKADFLTEPQRQAWAKYFDAERIKVIFFSATAEDPDNKKSSEEQEDGKDAEDNEAEKESKEDLTEDMDGLAVAGEYDGKIQNSSRVVTCQQLVTYFRSCHEGPKVMEGRTTVGLVGYPNVGKSSTLNAILQTKCVGVSATPGKTKHFQTIPVTEDLTMCDCPGLVMPSAVVSKADMILHGVLPVDQLRDHVPPTELLVTRIPTHVLASLYGLVLPSELNSELLLNAFGFNRGFMTANGQPDNPRAARYVLKDYVTGRLRYCHAPPGTDQAAFHTFDTESTDLKSLDKHANPRYIRAVKGVTLSPNDLNKQFFAIHAPTAHRKGVAKILAGSTMTDKDAKNLVANQQGKPWKIINKHANKNKKEKLRRRYRELDEH